MERSADFIISFALSVLAVYRMANMIANEDGPFDMFSRIRERVGQKNWIGRGLHCQMCISFWLALIPAIFMPHFIMLDWLAIAGMVTIIVKRLNQR